MSARSEARSYFLYKRLITHLSTPLYRNGYFLTFSSLATSGIGLIYWIVAAHQYPTFEVGINTAIISAMTFLAGISEINLMSALIRFIPVAGRSTRRLVLYSYVVSLIFAVLISVVFISNLQHWSPTLDFLGKNRSLSIWFTISTMLWCIFVLQDSVLTGLRRASWVPIENTVFSLTKIVLMLIFAVSIPTLGIFASWSFALLVAIIPTNYYIFRKLIPLHTQQENQINTQIEPGQIVRYVGPDYLGAIFWLICTTLMPVIVASVAGATANAYYYLAWMIANTLYLISPSMGSSLIVEAVNNPQKLAIYSHKVFKNTIKLVFPAAIIITIGAPFILMIFGRGYSAEGATLLRLLALSAIPNTVNAIFMSVSRVQRRMSAVVLTSGLLYSLVLGLSFTLLKFIGIEGIGIGWLASQLVIAGIVYMTQLRKLWSNAGESDIRPGAAVLGFDKSTTLIHFLYQIGTTLRIVPYLAVLKKKWDLRKRQARILNLLPEIIKELPDDLYNPERENWKVQSIANNDTNTAVVFFGSSSERSPLVLKIPENPKEAESLHRQNENLIALCDEKDLGDWRDLLPIVLTKGKVDGQFFYAERALPGITVLRMIRNRGHSPTVTSLAATAIQTLHLKTAKPLVVGMDVLEDWVNAPLKKLSHFIGGNSGNNSHRPAIDRLETELNVALAGRQVSASWIHGDYSPANILIHPQGSHITGIVDWDLARPNELPVLDLFHLLISIRMELERRELGHIVKELLLNQSWRPDELEQISIVERDLPGDVLDLRILLLLAWLHHIDANLNKTTRYDRNSLWASENILSVLKAV